MPPHVAHAAEALVGCQGRGCAAGVPPDFCPALFLAALLLQESSKGVVLLGQRGSISPRNPIRAMCIIGA